MKIFTKCTRPISQITLLTFIFTILVFPVQAYTSGNAVEKAYEACGEYLLDVAAEPIYGSIGGEWAVIGLCRSGLEIPQTFIDTYIKNLTVHLKSVGGELHKRKYTEYSRVSLALTAIGADPRNIAGYDLLLPLGDFNKTIWQGINGPIWALIALDSGNYLVPENKAANKQATRRMYIDEILSRQLKDGGWALSGNTADPDITAMALQALAPYTEQDDVSIAVESALHCLSKMQNNRGGFSSWDTENAESCAQVIVAMCALKIPQSDARFVKNGNSPISALLSFQNSDGSFRHTADEAAANQMATEQAFYALAALYRLDNKQPSLYQMTDRASYSEKRVQSGLANKHTDVQALPIIARGITFSDMPSGIIGLAVETLAERGIINGRANGCFDANAKMTRAEFAAIIVKALGLTKKTINIFTDVSPDKWYAPYIGAAYSYGIIRGTSNGCFTPDGIITKEEAAVMLARAAKLCGCDTDMSAQRTRSVLSAFSDSDKLSSWAIEAAAFCYSSGICDNTTSNISPHHAVLRGEIALMLYRLLMISALL